MRNLILFLTFFLIADLTSAQKTINGVIVDDNVDPVPGTTVIIKGTSLGTITDSEGQFSITIDSLTLSTLDTTQIKLSVPLNGFLDQEFETDANNIIQITHVTEVLVSGSREEIPRQRFGIVKVFYGTDRTSEVDGVKTEFTFDRGPISYGACQVSVPVNRRRGWIPRPSLIRFEVERADKHFILKEINPLTQGKFFQDINAGVKQSQSKSTFIFIHGYNVSFEDAALRTAQLYKDLAFDGVPIFYSWPSKNSFMLYASDESNIEWSEPHIKDFIADVLKRTQSQNLYLIAHSMGTRGLTKALNTLMLEQPELRSKVRQVILAAPDIDAGIFRDNIVSKMTGVGHNVTLYAASNDLALKASKLFHGYRRAGQSGNDIVVIKGIETIDASSVKASDFFVLPIQTRF